MPIGRMLPSCLALAMSVSTAFAEGPSCEPGKVAQKYPGIAGKTIKVGADPQTPPYVMRDPTAFETVIGIDADLAKAVFECAGVKHEFVLGAWSGLLPAVQAGQIDVMWDDLYYRPARAKVVDFVVYMQAATGALVTGGNPKKVVAIDDLCGLTVSFGLGSSNELAVKKQDEACKEKGKPAITAMPFQDLASGLRLLDSGRADVIMWDLGFVDNLSATNKAKYARAFAIMDGFKVGVGVTKNNPDLVKAIHESLQVIQKDGSDRPIFAKYNVDPELRLPTEIKTD